jgi:hypothetical protein
MKSKIFYSKRYQTIAQNIKTFINKQKDFLSERTADSPRAVGDAVQSLLEDNLQSILGADIKDYAPEFARRAMADIAFKDQDDFYYIIDIKTHNMNTSFNMPNLTSVERLARFYQDDKNYFVVLLIAYRVKGTRIEVERVDFVPLEFFSWDCLTIGALGWGQIQIANSNIVKILPHYSRRKWMLELCDTLFEFYPREISKIDSRIKYFKKVKAFWRKKDD